MWINAALSFEHSISFNSTKSVRFLQIQHCLGYKLILAVGLELLKNKKKDLGEKDLFFRLLEQEREFHQHFSELTINCKFILNLLLALYNILSSA